MALYDEEDYNKLLQEFEELKKQYEESKKQLEEFQKAVQKAYLDPETREPLKKILKKHANLEIDDPEYEKAVKEHVSRLEQKIAEFEEKETQKKMKEKEEKLRALFVEYGIDEAEIPNLAEFIKKTGLAPTTEEGWAQVLRNYQRTKMVVPTQIRPKAPTEKGALPEDYVKNPVEAFYKDHLKALKIL